MRPFLTRHMSLPAFLLVAVALFAVAAGSATAAALITSKNIKDGTIQSRDLDDSAVTLSKVSASTRASLRADNQQTLSRLAALESKAGIPGPAGTNGASGANGAPGAKGDSGADGVDGANGENGANGSNGENGENGAKGDKGDTGATGQTGVAGSNATVDSGNWGTVNRNTIGGANAELRAGPAPAPLGKGSLNLNVADAASKIAYGNEVDFRDIPLSGINVLGFSAYQTGEDAVTNAGNLPNLAIEIDPTGPPSNGTAPNFSTLVSVTPAGPVNQWRTIDAAAGQFYLTGSAGTASGCNQATYCSLAQVKAFYPAATLYTAQISKGRDYAFHGSVDALKIGSKTINFEETGVTTTG